MPGWEGATITLLDICGLTSGAIIRARLGVEIYEAVFVLVLRALQQHGLVKGRNAGIDASVFEANASPD